MLYLDSVLSCVRLITSLYLSFLNVLNLLVSLGKNYLSSWFNLIISFQNLEEFDLHNNMSLHVTDVVSEIQRSILALCEAERVFLFNIPLLI